jgi:hypothetical protein
MTVPRDFSEIIKCSNRKKRQRRAHLCFPPSQLNQKGFTMTASIYGQPRDLPLDAAASDLRRRVAVAVRDLMVIQADLLRLAERMDDEELLTEVHRRRWQHPGFAEELVSILWPSGFAPAEMPDRNLAA